jgi:sulfide:quinone oxidoreductase
VTDAGTFDADVLVVALGADYDVAATQGLAHGSSTTGIFQPPSAALVAEKKLFGSSRVERGLAGRSGRSLRPCDTGLSV